MCRSKAPSAQSVLGVSVEWNVYLPSLSIDLPFSLSFIHASVADQPSLVHTSTQNGLLDHAELEEMGITDPLHQEKILATVTSLPLTRRGQVFSTLEEWLSTIHLPQYVKVFRKHNFGEMERVRKIWEVELSVVLEVTLQGHRKRMLASLGDRPIEPELPASLAPQELSLELSKLVRNQWRLHYISQSLSLCLS